jgi:hypothetical protein
MIRVNLHNRNFGTSNKGTRRNSLMELDEQRATRILYGNHVDS